MVCVFSRRLFFTRLFQAIILTSALTGCFSKEPDPEDYVTTYEHVRAQLSTGRSAARLIYWLDNQHVLLAAGKRIASGGAKMTLLKVSIDGTTERLVELEKYSYYYCLLGKDLYVHGKDGNSTVLSFNSGLNIHVGERAKIDTRIKWTGMRCDAVALPDNKLAFYKILMSEDGFFEQKIDDPAVWDTVVHVKGGEMSRIREGKDKWTDAWERGARHRAIWDTQIVNYQEGTKVKIQGKFPVLPSLKEFHAYSNAYFGHSIGRECSRLWWLYRDDWRIESRKVCLPEWGRGGTTLFTPTKVGIFVMHMATRRPASYLITDTETIELKRGVFSVASTSPDGCKVAYLEEDSVGGPPLEFKKVLKVMDVCKFITDRESTYATDY